MNIVLCMAGLYSRFKEAGYTLPKYLLSLESNRTILEVVIKELFKSNNPKNLLLVMNKRDEKYLEQVREILGRIDSAVASEILLIEDTMGQAETAKIACEHLLKVNPSTQAGVLFHNIDTIIKNRKFSGLLTADANIDGLIDVFPSDSPSYSYVRVNTQGEALEMKEKVVISNHATSGAYYFSSLKDYLSFYSQIVWQKERYISEVYQAMITAGKKIRTFPGSGEDTVILGTPLEYENYLARKKL